ncbi:hypothetical protein [Cyclobacterium marinum]|uniref:hypothetical protein n=1 Tax=Cyclobacterium marinum TaxID=104 RepID=UPI001F552C7E|nr:hypothetical protein [Cyclobacterium marinum]
MSHNKKEGRDLLLFKVSIKLGIVSDGVEVGDWRAYTLDKDIINTIKNSPDREVG